MLKVRIGVGLEGWRAEGEASGLSSLSKNCDYLFQIPDDFLIHWFDLTYSQWFLDI